MKSNMHIHKNNTLAHANSNRQNMHDNNANI